MKKLIKLIMSGILFVGVFLLNGSHTIAAENYTERIEFDTNRVLKGTYDNSWVYFNIPEYWSTESVNARLDLELSPLLIDAPATLTFYLDDTPVYSMELNYKNGEHQTIAFDADVSELDAGYHSFHVAGAARIYDEEGCIDDKTEANWTVIDKASYIELGYNILPCQGLKDYPYPFISTVNEDGENLTIVVPDEPTDSELSAAGYIRAHLATFTTDDKIELTNYSAYAGKDGNAIYVGIYDRLPSGVSELLKDSDAGKKLKDDNAYLYLQSDEVGHAVLIATAKNDTNLVYLAKSMASEKLIDQYSSREAWPAIGNMKSIEAKGKEVYTVAELSGNRAPLEFNGAFRQEQTLYLPERGYILGGNGNIDLTFRYSKNLDFNKSVLTVYFDNTPVASHKLLEEKADYDRLVCSIPEDMIGKNVSSIRLVFQLELPETYCTYQITSLPWASVDSNSSFNLPVGDISTLSFDAHPYPFVKRGCFDNTIFVIPDRSDASELNLLGEMISLYAQGTSGTGELGVIKESGLDGDIKSNNNLVYVGTIGDFVTIEEYKDLAPFSYMIKDSRFLGNEEMPLSTTYATSISILQLLPSVHAEDKSVLLALTANKEACDRLTRFLSAADNRVKLEKDTVIIDKDDEVKAFEFHLVSAQAERPTLRQRLENKKESVEFTLISTFAMIILLLSSILILIRSKSRDKKVGKTKRYRAKH